MLCKNCGEQIADGMGICQNCGTPVEVKEESVVVENSASALPDISNVEKVETLTPLPDNPIGTETLVPEVDILEPVAPVATNEVLGQISGLEAPVEEVKEEAIVFDKPKKEKSNNSIIVSILLLIIGLAVGAAFMYYFVDFLPLPSKETKECPICEEKNDEEIVKEKSASALGYVFKIPEGYAYETTSSGIVLANDLSSIEIVIVEKMFADLKASKDILEQHFITNGYTVKSIEIKSLSDLEVVNIAASKDGKEYIFGYTQGLNNKTYGVSAVYNNEKITEDVWEVIAPILKTSEFSETSSNGITKPVENSSFIKDLEI